MTRVGHAPPARRGRFWASLIGSIALSALAASPVLAADRHVRIINDTDHTMVHFYASNTARGEWEEDILGSDTLASGAAVSINIDDGSGMCHFDFKAVFDDGDVVIKHNINVCEISEYHYTE